MIVYSGDWHNLTFIQISLIEAIRPRNIHIIQTRNISMSSEMLQQLYLPQRPLGQNLLAEDIGDFLYRDTLARLVVRGCAYDPVGALSELFGHGVALVDDEVLVEDFEYLAALQCWVGHADGLRMRCFGKS